jgi:hypothetical protein
MKQHKQALSRYEEAISDIESARRLKDANDVLLGIQLENLSHKVKLKIAMSHYYQGDMPKSTSILKQLVVYY